MKRFLTLSLCLLIASFSFSQELNGVWKGTLTQQPGGCFPVYNVELQVTITNNQVDGFCYHYSDFSNYVKKNYNGFYNAATKTINIQELKVITFHIPQDCTPCIRYFTLAYAKQGKEETLSGDWGGVVMNGSAACTPGKIVLHRSPGDAAWTFVSVDDLPSPEYTWSLKGSGHSAEVDDGHTANGECHYGITVQDGGSTYSSDENPKQTAPPMIVNQ